MAAVIEPQEVERNEVLCEPRNTVVVTGFGPFSSHNVNASWEAVRLLPTTRIDQELGICLVVEQIPVSYEDVGTKVPKMWENHKPLLVIHVGVSDLARKMTLEQVAQKSGYNQKDIYGCVPLSKECNVGSAPLKRSALDIAQLNNEINATSTTPVETQLSENAGRYLCEYIYYTSLSIDDSRSLFVHVPPLNNPYSAEELAQGLAEVIRRLVLQLRSSNKQ